MKFPNGRFEIAGAGKCRTEWINHTIWIKWLDECVFVCVRLCNDRRKCMRFDNEIHTASISGLCHIDHIGRIFAFQPPSTAISVKSFEVSMMTFRSYWFASMCACMSALFIHQTICPFLTDGKLSTYYTAYGQSISVALNDWLIFSH